VATPTDLNEAEQSLWAAFPAGLCLDLRAGDGAVEGAERWGPGRTIRAEVVAALLLGAASPEPGRFPAVHLRGARVTGPLDVTGATVGCALVCEGCFFDTAPQFVDATTKALRFVDSRLAGFNGARMRVEGILELSRTKLDGELRLERATVTGDVCLPHAVISDAGPGEAVAARGMVVDGDLDCTNLTSHGPVRLRNARIGGSFYLTDAKISSRETPAVDATNAVIGSGIDGKRLTVTGETRLRHTRIAGSLGLASAQLHNPNGASLGGGGLTVEAGVWCDHISAIGEMRLVGAQLGANLTLTAADLSNPGGAALNLDRATLGDLDAAGLTVSGGSVSLVSAQIASRVNLTGAQLDSRDGAIALNADGASIGRRLIMTHAKIRGEVTACTGHVHSRLTLRGAQLENPGGTALRLAPIEVDADMFGTDMTVIGRIDLTGASIGRHLDLTRARLANPGGVALDAKALQATELSLLPAEAIQGSVDLSHARLGVLRDDPQTWPQDMRLGGLSYEALEPELPAQQRLAWLERNQTSPSPQPYEQLAALYTRIGHPADARQVLYAAERRQRATKALPGRAWSFLQDITVGYGYRPARAALWLTALLIIGSVIYGIWPPQPLSTSATPHFNPVIYTLDLLLPLVDLGQKHAFNPAGLEQWLSYMLIAAGWILATTIAAGVARIITRQ
jgi:hypothetical protein